MLSAKVLIFFGNVYKKKLLISEKLLIYLNYKSPYAKDTLSKAVTETSPYVFTYSATFCFASLINS